MLPRLMLPVTKCDQIAKAPFVQYYHKLVLSIYLCPKEMTLSYIVNFLQFGMMWKTENVFKV
jgi:hypothetical protein